MQRQEDHLLQILLLLVNGLLLNRCEMVTSGESFTLL